MEYKLKIVTGYNEDQQFSIDAEEGHKAYYLFRNPEKRGVFSDGLAITGKDIRVIQPDYNGTLGYNKNYKLDEHDYAMIVSRGLSEKLQRIMGHAKDVSYLMDNDIDMSSNKLSEILLDLKNNGMFSIEGKIDISGINKLSDGK